MRPSTQLVAAELIFRRGTPPDARYTFKHALVQDAAYQSLLKSRRQQLHAAVGGLLQERFPATAQATPEMLAHHYTEAGLALQAIPRWFEAGRIAIGRPAYSEAIAHLSRGLELLNRYPITASVRASRSRYS